MQVCRCKYLNHIILPVSSDLNDDVDVQHKICNRFFSYQYSDLQVC